MTDSKDQSGQHRRFDYTNITDLNDELNKMGIKIPVSQTLDVLHIPLFIAQNKISNRLAIHPMEGCDGLTDGRPSDLTRRRYERFARGGAALIWVEATAVTPSGRANPRQLMLNQTSSRDFAELADLIDRAAPEPVYKVLQLTHSGRYSRPVDTPFPQTAGTNPWLDKAGQTAKIMTDRELADLVSAYVESARLARVAGFDAVDIKACHGYLISELLGARYREGEYGGSFSGRTRLLLQIIEAVSQQADIDIAVRLNAYDEVPQPYGWGVMADDHHQPDWDELKSLMRQLAARGVVLADITGGNPYYNPHVNRPYDSGPYVPPFHQLVHVYKLFEAARQAKAAAPDIRIIATGFSWFRHLAGHLAAGMIEQDWCDLAGFGRQSFAYPNFAHDLLSGGLKREKCCIACGKCSEIMRDGGRTGCVIHDRSCYRPIYQAGRKGKPNLTSHDVREHV